MLPNGEHERAWVPPPAPVRRPPRLLTPRESLSRNDRHHRIARPARPRWAASYRWPGPTEAAARRPLNPHRTVNVAPTWLLGWRGSAPTWRRGQKHARLSLRPP